MPRQKTRNLLNLLEDFYAGYVMSWHIFAQKSASHCNRVQRFVHQLSCSQTFSTAFVSLLLAGPQTSQAGKRAHILTARLLQVAGLDVGWGQQVDMKYNQQLGRYEVTRHLPPGRFPYKFVMDGRWTYSADHPTFTVSLPQSTLLGILHFICHASAQAA